MVVYGDRLSAASPLSSPGFVVLQTLGAAGRSVAALALLRRREGRQASRRIGEGYTRWRVGVRWYAVAALLIPAINVAVLAGDALIGDDAVAAAGSPLHRADLQRPAGDRLGALAPAADDRLR